MVVVLGNGGGGGGNGGGAGGATIPTVTNYIQVNLIHKVCIVYRNVWTFIVASVPECFDTRT